jgi:hypothetical protein
MNCGRERDGGGTLAPVGVPAPRTDPGAPLRVTATGSGSPPLPVLARVAHVFCGPTPAEVWPMVRREVTAGSVTVGDLVLLRVGRGMAEEWTELAIAAPEVG